MLKLKGVSSVSVGVLRLKWNNQRSIRVIGPCWQNDVCRTMVTKPYKSKKEKPAPWPYQTKTLTPLDIMMDLTLARFDENTKFIVVEGPVHSGKHEVAQKIAEEYDMKYIPPLRIDSIYINPSGYDMRNLDSKLPLSVRSYDDKKFNEDPRHFNAAAYQIQMLSLRFKHYMNCLTHILNTGDGVVTVRSPFSDFVWTEAMFQSGYISPQVRYYYYEVIRHSIHNLYRPHLIVYLDAPVNKTIENIKTKGHDYEVNSKALTPEFIQQMESAYKKKYLLEAQIASEVLCADFSEENDVDAIIEDIEAIDFDSERMPRDPKFTDWRRDEWWHDYHRYIYTDNAARCKLMYSLDVPNYDCPELFAPDREWEAYRQIWNNAPGMEYAAGYNPKRGDKPWFKPSKKLFESFHV